MNILGVNKPDKCITCKNRTKSEWHANRHKFFGRNFKTFFAQDTTGSNVCRCTNRCDITTQCSTCQQTEITVQLGPHRLQQKYRKQQAALWQHMEYCQ